MTFPSSTASVTITGFSTETTLEQVRDGISSYETRFDYDVRTDGNPVYIGKAPQGTSTAAITWEVLKFTYDASNRATRIEVLTGAWDNRAALPW